MHCKFEEKLLQLGFDLSKFTSPTPKANYVSCVKSGNLLFLAGHVPYNSDNTLSVGKVGSSVSLEEGYQFARWITVSLLKTVKNNIGELSRINKIVKLNGMVNCDGNFHDHPKVINGASDLLVEVFGKEIGSHARTAVGCPSLPFNVPVEIDMIVEIKE